MSIFSEWFVFGLLRSSLGLSAAALLVALAVRGLRLRSPRGEQIAWLLVLLQGVVLAPGVLPIPRDWMAAAGQARQRTWSRRSRHRSSPTHPPRGSSAVGLSALSTLSRQPRNPR